MPALGFVNDRPPRQRDVLAIRQQLIATGADIDLTNANIINYPISLLTLSKTKGTSQPASSVEGYTNIDFFDTSTGYTSPDYRPLVNTASVLAGPETPLLGADLSLARGSFSWDETNQVATLLKDGVYIFNLNVTFRQDPGVFVLPIITFGLGINLDATNVDQPATNPLILAGGGSESRIGYGFTSISAARFFPAGTTLRLYAAFHASTPVAGITRIGPMSASIEKI